MSATLSFWVPGIPVPKERARTVRTKSGKVRSFTPPRTVRWEDAIRTYAMRSCALLGWKPLTETCVLTLVVHRARRAGDADNFAKAFKDACNGVLYVDDRLVRKLVVEMVDGKLPGILATIVRDA